MNQVTQKTEPEDTDASEAATAPPDVSSEATESFLVKRRRFVAHAAAAPVLLAVSGRSALACSTVPTGLSFAQWASVHPQGGGTACVSHTVGGKPHTGCRSHTDWTPKNTGTCFTELWPSQCKPFVKCQQRYWSYGLKRYRVVDYVQDKNYTDMCHYWNDTPTPCGGWNGQNKDGYNFASGTKLTWLDSSRSCSKILVDHFNNPKANDCKPLLVAAYLNACKFPDSSVLSTAEVQELATRRQIGSGGYALTDQEICDFLSQTWS